METARPPTSKDRGITWTLVHCSGPTAITVLSHPHLQLTGCVLHGGYIPLGLRLTLIYPLHVRFLRAVEPIVQP